eukprot:15452719-Alexandrium_andersonii.AAC.1
MLGVLMRTANAPSTSSSCPQVSKCARATSRRHCEPTIGRGATGCLEAPTAASRCKGCMPLSRQCACHCTAGDM